jgi:hypothetical protein
MKSEELFLYAVLLTSLPTSAYPHKEQFIIICWFGYSENQQYQ